MNKNESNVILDLTFEFSLRIMEYCDKLDEIKRFTISTQLLKSGTSIGANVREAQSAESKADFIHKIKIASKETEETEYWLMLCKFSSNYPDCKHLLEKMIIIKKIISKIIITSKK